MPETATKLERKCVPPDGTKVRLLRMDALDGRTTSVKRVRQFETQITSDLGGNLSSAEAALVRRSAVLVAVLDNSEAAWAKDGSLVLSDYVTATNTLRRLLLSLGLERRPRSLYGGDRLGELLGGS